MLIRASRALVLLVPLVLALAVGCGGGQGSKAGAGSATVIELSGPGTDPSENFGTGEAFIQALAANTPEQLALARSLAASKSSAARYLTSVQRPTGPLTVTKLSEGTYQLCAGNDCSKISGFVLSDGKISSFKVDGQQIR